jgi:hypothetical protein
MLVGVGMISREMSETATLGAYSARIIVKVLDCEVVGRGSSSSSSSSSTCWLLRGSYDTCLLLFFLVVRSSSNDTCRLLFLACDCRLLVCRVGIVVGCIHGGVHEDHGKNEEESHGERERERTKER